jgi:catechol 2,3-dioxygenase-like lactoylglutathione lyase family enzyme
MIIRQLVLYTSRLSQQTAFYSHALGMEPAYATPGATGFHVGHTELVFCYRKDATPYHFAINIPSNMEQEALQWIRQKTEVRILPYHGKELVDYKNSWNASSVYFYDADHNIVELIARKNLAIQHSGVFGPEHFLGVSEIGLSVHNIAGAFTDIASIHSIPLYDGNFDKFCAAGDEQGLFIIVDQDKKGWFPSHDFAFTSDFSIRGDIDMDFINGKVIPVRLFA